MSSTELDLSFFQKGIIAHEVITNVKKPKGWKSELDRRFEADCARKERMGDAYDGRAIPLNDMPFGFGKNT